MDKAQTFDEWYFGYGEGTYYKYSKELLADEKFKEDTRKSHEYDIMRTAWNASEKRFTKEGI